MDLNQTSKSMTAKKFALGFGIALVFPLMVHYGVCSYSPAPKWQDYRAEGTNSLDAMEREQARPEQRRLDVKLDAASAKHEKDLFVVTAPVGILAVIAGALISVQAIGSGLMFGGIFCLLDGYFNYWGQLSDFLRFLSLAAGFLVLIFIGYKKLK